jgi:predicted DNA-binding helix-hairpin-helix protein
LQARRSVKFQELSQLRKVGINPERAAPFVLLNGHHPPVQLALF